jgi:phosphoribosyl 1,2-cyclic phosphate phosphodiesterase
MKLTLLGSGTSQGVPVIGCDCRVCQSNDPRDQRLRQSALITFSEKNVLLDAGPDLRQQLLRACVRSLEGIIITHEHNDHLIGLDDVRPFNFSTGKPMKVYALRRVLDEISRRFDYIFGKKIPGLPEIELVEISKNVPFQIAGIDFQPIEIMHGRLPILGFRIKNLAYLTDCKMVAADQFEQLRGVEKLFLTALHHDPHPSHLNLEEALLFVEKLQPTATFLIHTSHRMGLQSDIEPTLPSGVKMGFDGLQIDF